MYVNYKALLGLGIVFWSLFYYTDILGESTWKRCSSHVEDILRNQKVNMKKESFQQKMSLVNILWNIFVFICSIIFYSALRSTSWIVWKIIKIFSYAKNKKNVVSQIPSERSNNEFESSADALNNTKSQIIFQSDMFSKSFYSNDFGSLSKELEQLRNEKCLLEKQLILTQTENITARQQIEEYKLETTMMQDQLTKVSNTLKENKKYKDYAAASHEFITKKVHSLESHLRDVCREREILRSQLGKLEQKYLKLQEQMKTDEKDISEANNEIKQYPERDTTKLTSEKTITDNYNLQKTSSDLEDNFIPYNNKNHFEANSKISIDLEESNTSKEDTKFISENNNKNNKFYANFTKQNMDNYNAYKTQMMKPTLKIKNGNCPHMADTYSSSEDSSTPHRIISSTAEFQNFLKTLSSYNRS